MELPRRISRLGQVLGALYLVLVLSSALPPRLLSPEWQMQVVAACIDSAAIPLLRSSLRLMLSALLVGLGFAALAQAPGGGPLLLRGWLARLGQGAATNQRGSGRIVDGDDFLEISGNDPATNTTADPPAVPPDEPAPSSEAAN